MSLSVPLEQLIPLLPNPSGFFIILPQRRRHGLECLLGLISIPTGLGHPRLKTGRILGEGGQLSHILLGGNKLSYHLPA